METLQGNKTKTRDKSSVLYSFFREKNRPGLSLDAKAVRFSADVGGEQILERRSPSNRDFSSSLSRLPRRPTSSLNHFRPRSPYNNRRSPIPHINSYCPSLYNHIRSRTPFTNARSPAPYTIIRSLSPFNRNRLSNPSANQAFTDQSINLGRSVYRNNPHTREKP